MSDQVTIYDAKTNLSRLVERVESGDGARDRRDLRAHLVDEGFTELPVTGPHADAVAGLPAHLRDPSDRMLVAQARIEGLTLVTADRRLSEYDVPPVLRADRST